MGFLPAPPRALVTIAVSGMAVSPRPVERDVATRTRGGGRPYGRNVQSLSEPSRAKLLRRFSMIEIARNGLVKRFRGHRHRARIALWMGPSIGGRPGASWLQMPRSRVTIRLVRGGVGDGAAPRALPGEVGMRRRFGFCGVAVVVGNTGLRVPVAAPLWMVSVAVVVGLLGGVGSASAAARTTRVSVASSGAQAHKASVPSGISRDGRLVLFSSASHRLVKNDTNRTSDVFLHHRVNGRTRLISVAVGGGPANGWSYGVAITPSGRWMLFNSGAKNLTHTPTVGPNVFLRDRRHRVTRLVSIKPGGGLFTRGAWGVAVSDNGRYVLFETNSAGYLRDLQRGRTRRIARRQPTRVAPLGLSSDGRFFAYVDLRSATNLRVHDRATGHTFRVPLPPRWTTFGRLTFTGDDRYVFFDADTSTNFVVARWKRGTPRVRTLTGSADASLDGISGNGRYLAFESETSTLVPGDTNHRPDLFRQDLTTGTVKRVDLTAAGGQIKSGITFVGSAFISRNGAWVTFSARTDGTVAGDTNGIPDAFERGPLP
jgi:Tol biopolymer transport system component